MKNILKSIFIIALPVTSLVLLFFGCYILFYNSKYNFLNISAIIISFTVTFFFASIYINPIARTSKYLTSYSVPIIIGLLITIIGISNGIKAPYTISSNILITIGWLLYLKWYSVLDDRNKTILSVGKKLPKFELVDLNNNKVNSKDFNGKTTLFIFYRGNWCPFCMAQLREIVSYEYILKDKNVRILLISSQPIKKAELLNNKFNTDFEFLIDFKNKVAKELGISSENGLPAGFQALGYDSDIVLPTVLVTDPKGVLVYVDLTDNYRIRPKPKTYIKIIENI